ncbi:hypothetical protein Fmac_028733 [Flemingia macrophylla]|uniref:Uncharacterized protein n=1 Tax=Flemingia macrophylla TaxID=520843 RepID=A0ABD1L8B7_9FABA
MAPNSYQFSARDDAIVIRGVHNMSTDTSTETRKLEVKLDALLNLVTQLAANQKPASVARQSGVDDHPEAYAINTYRRPPHNSRGKALDREDGSQLLTLRIRSLPLPQESTESVLPMTTKLVSILLRSNLEWTSILRHMLQTPKAYHHNSRGKALDREHSFQLLPLEGKLDALVNLVTQLAVNQKPAFFAIVCSTRSSNDHHTSFSARNDVIVIRGVHDVATNTSTETRKLEVKLDALVNLVTQLAANQKPASFVRVCDICFSNDHHTSVCPSSQKSKVDEHPDAYFSARNDAIIIKGAHDVAIDTSVETRKLEGKLDALVKLVTLLAVNQKPASIARVYVIRSSNNNHTSVSPSSKQSGVDKLPEAYAANTYSRPPQQGVHDVATDSSAETRKLEGKLDALVNLVTQPAVYQKPATVARVYGIRSSNNHHTSVSPSSKQSGVDKLPEAYAANTYSRPPQQQRPGTS